MNASPDTQPRDRRTLLLALGLVLLTLAAFLPALDNGFVDYDDGQYVTANPRVQEGLTLSGVRWALTAEVAGNWHPLTLLSHMLDCQLFGLEPRGHHLTSLLLHLANVVLLFAVLARMTGARWRSALVAALFAVHPTHVESVAWVAERKDVLCALFWLLGMGAYLRYVRRPSVARYLPVAAALALALAAKPMAVTFPLVLLLLDLWPLGRLRLEAGSPGLRTGLALVVEKLPLLAMSLAAGIATLAAQEATVSSLARLPFGARLANAAVAGAAYLGKTLVPRELAAFYPLRGDLSAWQVAAAAALLAALTAAAVVALRRAPYLTVGWSWFLVTLAPVAGLIQVGAQAMADRYTYLPSIGLFIALAWGAAALVAGRHPRPPRQHRAAVVVASGLAAVAVVALVPVTRAQVATWADTATLFRHALAVTRDNYLAHINLAYALEEAGGAGDEALAHFRTARAIVPRSVEANAALGTALAARGRPAEALPYLRTAVAVDPKDARVRVDLAAALDDLGDREGAIVELRAAVALDPGLAPAHHGLGMLLLAAGRSAEAAVELRAAVGLDPALGRELAPVLAGLGGP